MSTEFRIPTWQPPHPVPDQLACHQALFHHNRIYLLMGGGHDTHYTNEIRCFHLDTQQYTVLSTSGTPPRGAHNAQVALYNDSVFVFSGRTADADYSSYRMHRLDLRTLTWHCVDLPPDAPYIPTGRQLAQGFVYGGYWYLFGGVAVAELNDMVRYRFDSNHWELVLQRGDVPSPRAGHAAVLCDDMLYTFGGNTRPSGRTFQFSNTVHQCDMRTFEWRQIEVRGPQMPQMAGHVAVLHGRGCFLFGGWNAEPYRQYFNHLYYFNFDTQRFSLCDFDGLPPSPRSAMAAVSARCSVYICGGWKFTADQGRIVYADIHELRLPVEQQSDSQFAVEMQRMLADGRFHDVELIVEGHAFRLHRAVLAARCPYFDAMFGGGMRESTEYSILLSDVARQPFTRVLQYIYSNRVDLTADTAADVLVLAVRMGVQGLQRACERYLTQYLEDEHVALVFQYAHSNHCDALLEHAADYILRMVPAKREPILAAMTPEQRAYLKEMSRS